MRTVIKMPPTSQPSRAGSRRAARRAKGPARAGHSALQAEIARSARLRKTPEVTFAFDPAIRTGARIEHILSSLHVEGDDAGDGEAAAQTEDGVEAEGGTS